MNIFRCIIIIVVALSIIQCTNDEGIYGPSPLNVGSDLYKPVTISILKPNASVDLAYDITYVSRPHIYANSGDYAMLFINKGGFPVYLTEVRGITYRDSNGEPISKENVAYIHSRTIKLIPGDIYTGTGFLPGDTGMTWNFKDSIFSKIASISIDSIHFDTGSSFVLPQALLSVASYSNSATLPDFLDLRVANTGSCAAKMHGFDMVVYTDDFGTPMAGALAFLSTAEDIIFSGEIRILNCESKSQIPWKNIRIFWEYEDTVTAGLPKGAQASMANTNGPALR
jgi:hypothetical protein